MYFLYFDTVEQRFSTIAALLVCGYALWRGGRTERFAAVVIFIDWFGTPLLQDQANLRRLQFAIFAQDGALAIALLGLALVAKRFWPLWAASFQLLELLMHIAMLIDHKVHARAYFVGMELWSYMLLITLAVGTWREAPKLPHQGFAAIFAKRSDA